VSKYAHRPYHERIALEADDFLKEIRSNETPDTDLIADALSILEGLRQEASVGPEDVAITERNRRLINDSINNDPVAPYNTVKGAQVQGLGIDGQFKPDSDVRIHTQYGDTNDTLLDDDVKQFGIRETGVQTEYLSPSAEDNLYKEWRKREIQGAADKGWKKPTEDNLSRENFNRFAGEYYGQQALKLAGNTAPSDSQRSYGIQRAGRSHPSSTLGTDRIVENSRALTAPEIKNSADYRYVTPQGELTTGDFQVQTYGPGQAPLSTDVRLQLIKGGNWAGEDRPNRQGASRIAQKLENVSEGITDIDQAFARLGQSEQIPPLVRGNIKQRYDSKGQYGIRGGKLTSNAPYLGQQNFDDQHQYDNVLYAVQAAQRLNDAGGSVPQGYYNVNADTARQHAAQLAQQGQLGGVLHMGNDGSVFIKKPLQALLEAGVATDLVAEHPQLRQLLRRNQG